MNRRQRGGTQRNGSYGATTQMQSLGHRGCGWLAAHVLAIATVPGGPSAISQQSDGDGSMVEIPRAEQPIEVRYALASEAYEEAAALARDYTENKSVVFSEMVMATLSQEPGVATGKAEHIVRASAGWQAFVKRLVEAKNEAGRLKTALKAIQIEADRIKQEGIRNATERKYSRYG